jgi:hypothetical protein
MGRVWLGLGYCVGGVQDFLRCPSGVLNSFHLILYISTQLGIFSRRGSLLQLLLSQATIGLFLDGFLSNLIIDVHDCDLCSMYM